MSSTNEDKLVDSLIPCVDVAGGRVTEPARIPGLDDPSDPVAIVGAYSDIGVPRAFLDISDGWDQLGSVLPLVDALRDEGIDALVSIDNGRVRTPSEVERLLGEGAAGISVSSSAVEDPETVAQTVEHVGHEHVMGVVNARSSAQGPWSVYVDGGRTATDHDATAFGHELARLGVGLIVANSVDREGTGRGYDHALTRAVAEAAGVPVIASGGCGTLEHLRDALTHGGATFVLANKMLHDGRVSLAELRDCTIASSSGRGRSCAP